MKKVIISLVFWFLFAASGQARIVERTIYAGDTPLRSDCTVSQSGPMELTIVPCFWTITGQAKIVDRGKVSGLEGRTLRGEVEMMADGKRVRGWMKREDGTVVRKSVKYRLALMSVFSITAGGRYVLYMVNTVGQAMNVVLMSADDPRPATFIDYLVFPFDVPAGTTDLTTIDMEVFTVKPGFPLPKDIFTR